MQVAAAKNKPSPIGMSSFHGHPYQIVVSTSSFVGYHHCPGAFARITQLR
ncbi:hypothetical protein VFPPC_16519 [Pochonia chlamydosporia 170]|uniref:Uncharacterized protein n=1 Tax=Pochonia chlamydosporia 170 TaxID=1380566 RepID=A0A179F7V9_METCM|nr:hypothetical protein VFPPC_16519 [Pochonia chlamydosporia 170]OAQ61506.1 hypothetical protein VFPPC_16519 [Pochonia chlamydosporia 170]